jgi:hypothetical protein
MWQINTFRKEALEIPIYFRDNKYKDFSEVFNPNKALELPNLSSIKYFINTDNMVLYRPLYNLLET